MCHNQTYQLAVTFTMLHLPVPADRTPAHYSGATVARTLIMNLCDY